MITACSNPESRPNTTENCSNYSITVMFALSQNNIFLLKNNIILLFLPWTGTSFFLYTIIYRTTPRSCQEQTNIDLVTSFPLKTPCLWNLIKYGV